MFPVAFDEAGTFDEAGADFEVNFGDDVATFFDVDALWGVFNSCDDVTTFAGAPGVAVVASAGMPEVGAAVAGVPGVVAAAFTEAGVPGLVAAASVEASALVAVALVAWECWPTPAACQAL